MAFHPYLYFAGNCRQAFTRYHEIFGGELTIMDGSDAPPGAVAPDKTDLVMHASLNNGDELLMASDSYDDNFTPAQGVAVHYSTSDLERARSIFEQLSEGGTVTMPGQEQFWTPFYGMVTDRFGIPWQVNVEASEDEGP
ncbi:MAG: VOC family protein [Acidimicrobiia bacterium]|nr:VOC family protein [Acidimicrobiia bacterium]